MGMDLQRLKKSRHHIISTDRRSQFDNGAFVKMRTNVRKRGVVDTDLTGHGIGKSKDRSLLRVEQLRTAPRGQLIELSFAEPFSPSDRRVLISFVRSTVQERHPHD